MNMLLGVHFECVHVVSRYTLLFILIFLPLLAKAFRAHRHVDVFDKPGTSDLTTNVDFALLKEALEDGGKLGKYLCMTVRSEFECAASLHGCLDQSSFLLRMGISQRLVGLMNKAQSEERRTEIRRAGKRLVDQAGQGMGKVYRVLGITGKTGGQKAEFWPFLSLLHEDRTDSEK